MNQPGVIEIVIYQTKANIDDTTHIKKASAVTPILANFTGFISRQFGKNTDGKWVDLVYWNNLSSAKKAADEAKAIPEFQEFFDDIDDQKMEFMHSTILHHYP